MVGFTGILAHQGGWDEMLLIAVPIALFVVLLRIANSRAARLADDDPAAPSHTAPSHTADEPGPPAGHTDR